MLTAVPNWITTPEQFLQAAEAGTRAAQENQRLGLETMSLLQRGAESAAARNQSAQQFHTNLAQKQAEDSASAEALKRGEFESDRDYALRLKQFGVAEAKQALDEKKLGMPKYYHDAKGGIYGIDPLTGELNILQQPQQAAGRVGTVSVPFSTEEGLPGRISVPENDPRLKAWRSLKPTVETVPGHPRAAFWNAWQLGPSKPTTITNQPPSLATYLRTNTPASGTELPDIEGLNEPQAAPLRVLSIE